MSSWQCSLAGLELRKLISYRLNFWSDFLGTTIFHMGVAYFVWSAVYLGAGSASLGGYSFEMILLYNLLVPIIGRATYAVEFTSTSEEVYSGALNRYLIYPISFFSYRLVQQFTNNLIVFVQLAIALSVFGLFIKFPPDFSMTPLRMVLFLLSVTGAMLLAFLISWSIQLIAFWTDQVWSLMVSFRFFVHFLGGAWIPMSLFPESAVHLLRLSPFYLVIGFPVEIFLGKLEYAQMWQPSIAMIFWIAVMSVFARFIWTRGLRVYTGVGI